MHQQENAVIWADRRGDEPPHVEFITERRLPEALQAAERQGFAMRLSTRRPVARISSARRPLVLSVRYESPAQRPRVEP
jgi:hypothetical protein